MLCVGEERSYTMLQDTAPFPRKGVSVITSILFVKDEHATTQLFLHLLSQETPYHIFWAGAKIAERSEEHTSELQSRSDLVCRLLLEKKKHTTQSLTGRYL